MPTDLVLSLINAEETARETALLTKEHQKKFRTNILDFKDFVRNPLDGSYLFLDKNGEGKINELVIISPTQDFSVIVEVDGILTYQGDFSKYQEISIHVSSIVAQERGSKYVLQLNDILFLNRIRIILDISEPTTFQRLYCKYLLAER